MKIDIEGHELSCLKGATGLINGRKIKIVQYEYGHAHVASKNSVQDFFNFFRPNGYVMGVIKPTGRLAFFERYDEFLEQLVSLF